ncbi:hypothetical protein G6F56_006045 [Rhizopus delemar]|nr:hypothetical protein G6F56_006045 [Rhizopus delemar]
MSFVIGHPWMNKGYDDMISNHLPHRHPLHDIDQQVVQGMQGFGLGSPERIAYKLERIIQSPEYQFAAEQIDQNYPQDTETARWRRSKRQPRPKDDPQMFPAVYDPLVSIYYLVQERRKLDAALELLQSEGYQSPVQLGRSASTSLSKSTKDGASQLMRRKTERVAPSHTRHALQDWAAPAHHTAEKPVKSTTNLLKRSKSAAKKLGAMLPSRSHESIEDVSLKQKTMNILRSNSLSYRSRHKEEIKSVEEESGGNKMSNPKSLFNFNRRHLFKISAKEMMGYVEQILTKMNIRYTIVEPFLVQCEYSFSPDEVLMDQSHVKFNLMIYQARWAGGRLGIKLLEGDCLEHTKESIYHNLLNDLNTLIKT